MFVAEKVLLLLVISLTAVYVLYMTIAFGVELISNIRIELEIWVNDVQRCVDIVFD